MRRIGEIIRGMLDRGSPATGAEPGKPAPDYAVRNTFEAAINARAAIRARDLAKTQAAIMSKAQAGWFVLESIRISPAAAALPVNRGNVSAHTEGNNVDLLSIFNMVTSGVAAVRSIIGGVSGTVNTSNSIGTVLQNALNLAKLADPADANEAVAAYKLAVEAKAHIEGIISEIEGTIKTFQGDPAAPAAVPPAAPTAESHEQ